MDNIHYFQDQARQCRDAAKRSEDRQERHGLEQLARHYDREAVRLARSANPPALGERQAARI
jgi:hypothetical protein